VLNCYCVDNWIELAHFTLPLKSTAAPPFLKPSLFALKIGQNAEAFVCLSLEHFDSLFWRAKMAKNKKAATAEHEQVALLEQDAIDKSTVTSLQLLIPSITVLGDILIEINENYQALVGKSQALHSAKEAGKSLRSLSRQYANVLMVALEYSYGDLEADNTLDDELDFEDEDKSDVDLLED
jgi:hypothetical protein